MRLLTPVCLLMLSLCSAAGARVEHIEILDREAFAPGADFEPVGAYERLRGRAWFALDATAVANAMVADLKFAPRDDRGLVKFSSDFLMLRPADSARSNGTLLYDVNNRGSIAILSPINEAPSNNNPTNLVDAGNGFLFRQGFTLLWSAWAADVVPGDARMVLKAPVATEGDKPITGRVAYELIVNETREQAQFTGRLGTPYPFAHEGAPEATLTERDRPEGERRPIARANWSFVKESGGGAVDLIRLASSLAASMS